LVTAACALVSHFFSADSHRFYSPTPPYTPLPKVSGVSVFDLAALNVLYFSDVVISWLFCVLLPSAAFSPLTSLPPFSDFNYLSCRCPLFCFYYRLCCAPSVSASYCACSCCLLSCSLCCILDVSYCLCSLLVLAPACVEANPPVTSSQSITCVCLKLIDYRP
jgi:hypothetical protein